MKDIVIEHKFKIKLSELLKSIRKEGYSSGDYEEGYEKMIKKINEYLEMIE